MVRAKFKVTSLSKMEGGMSSVSLTPVYGNGDPNHENTKFFKYTPSGEIKMACVNAETLAGFEPGTEFYVDFTAAPTATDSAEENTKP